jgi:ornithine carbamoyltransferase
MIFQKRSTRTRVSTETGMALLGGHALFLGPTDIQLGVNESMRDTANVLARFNDVILARVFGHGDVVELAHHSDVPVINALSDLHHPLQTLADLMTLQEHFGKENLRGKTVAWVGDGNNVLHDLALGSAILGMNVSVATPAGYEMNADILAKTEKLAAAAGASVSTTTVAAEAVKDSHVVVTDTWVSMGQEDEYAKRVAEFDGYQVTNELMAHADPTAVFLHCLPRHPEEVADEVFYSDKSLVFPEAENRMWTVMAVSKYHSYTASFRSCSTNDSVSPVTFCLFFQSGGPTWQSGIKSDRRSGFDSRVYINRYIIQSYATSSFMDFSARTIRFVVSYTVALRNLFNVQSARKRYEDDLVLNI